VASRLGDGIIWYCMLAVLPLLYSGRATRPVVIMAITGVLGVALYKALKRVFVRERPFITHSSISLAMAPLDRYSFPSGHTLHAVSFTWQAVAYFPELAWVLVPLASLIAASRVVLGLHYPTDVLAGAAIGSTLALLGLSFA
jgi:undecaprenyl-diphosphatase